MTTKPKKPKRHTATEQRWGVYDNRGELQGTYVSRALAREAKRAGETIHRVERRTVTVPI